MKPTEQVLAEALGIDYEVGGKLVGESLIGALNRAGYHLVRPPEFTEDEDDYGLVIAATAVVDKDAIEIATDRMNVTGWPDDVREFILDGVRQQMGAAVLGAIGRLLNIDLPSSEDEVGDPQPVRPDPGEASSL